MIEGIALASETSAARSGDYADVPRGHFQNLRQGAVEIVRRLRTRPQCQLPVAILDRYCRVLLNGKVCIPLEEEQVFEHFIRFGKPFVRVTEFKGHAFVNVPFLTVIVNPRLRCRKTFLRVRNRAQDLIVDVNKINSLRCRQLLARDYGGDGVSYVAHVIDA